MLVASVAGCSGDDTDSDSTDTGDTQTQQYPEDPEEVGESGMQRVFRNEVSTINLRAAEEVSVTDTEVVLDLTMQNTADQPAPLHEYGVVIYLYDQPEPEPRNSDVRINTGTDSEFNEDTQPETDPGGFTTLRYSTSITGQERTIQSYSVDIGCFLTSGDLPGC